MKQTIYFNKARGFSLIEVLITVLLLAIGFLVAAKMQITSLSSSQSAQMQTNAMQISAEMMDKMRNNPVGVADGLYDGITTSSVAPVTCPNSGCTPAQLASKDIFEWSAHFIDLRGIGAGFQPSLPGADINQPASASISQPVDGVYTIRVDWQGFVDGESVPESFVSNFIP